MINQSSLNDVFKFIEIKPANLLSAFPLTETPEIQALQQASLEQKQQQAEAFFQDLNFDIKQLKQGSLIIKTLDILLNNQSSHKNPKVSHFLDAVTRQHVDFESDPFKKDLALLSNVVYFSHFSKNHSLDNNHRQLFLAYQALIKAYQNPAFQQLLLKIVFDKSHKPVIKSVGKAHLLVVKQHLIRYEETDVAHIENVMKGETRSREHRFLDRFEQTLTLESEQSTETETELETKERFELNRESSKTIKEDHKLSAELSVSGQLGPAVKFSSNLSYDYGLNTETANKTASEYAKDIIDRSLQRVNERVREERITKILKENETKNLHSFSNKTAETEGASEPVHFSGIYQFVDKVYKAQVFDYGLRQIFDLMIPEPASYLWFFNALDQLQDDFNLPKPTFKLNNPFEIETKTLKYAIAGRPDMLNPLHYANLAKTYEATGIDPPPTTQVVTFSHQQPKAKETAGGSRNWALENQGPTGGWQFYPPEVLELTLPKNYLPQKIELHIQAFTDNRAKKHLNFYFNFGAKIKRFYKSPYNTEPSPEDTLALKYVMTGNTSGSADEGRNTLFECTDVINIEAEDSYDLLNDQSKFNLAYSSQDSANHTLSIAISCEPSAELVQQWQLSTYDKLFQSYQNQLLEYESQLAQYNANHKAKQNLSPTAYGIPPSKQQQLMLTELKKHTLALFTNNAIAKEAYTENFSVDTSSTPPIIDQQKALEQGDFIKFFEQAFEWSQLQYAFYPYFWSEYQQWDQKLQFDDDNYEFQQFMQASSARVVLPVRLGYEEAVAHYLHTGEIWEGDSVPEIGNPLYLSIIDEIKQRAGHSDMPPIAYGKPWEVIVPTSLIKLKADDQLPSWKQKEGESWAWEKDN